MRSADTALRCANLRRIHRDRMRPLRVLKALDNSAIFEKSPVEIKEGYVIADRDTGDLFLTLMLRSLSTVPLLALDIRILLYREQNCVPYQKLNFRYSWEEATFGVRLLNGKELKEKRNRPEKNLECGEEFGEGIYIPLPESYFKKMQIELEGVTYGDGRYEKLGLVAGGKAAHFPDVDSELKQAYRHLNIFEEAEQEHPIRVLPQAGENVWLCCCGHKNPIKETLCEACGRDKNWQFDNLTLEQLEKTKQSYVSDPERRILHDKTNYPQNRYLESERELQKKVERCNQVMQRIAAQEKEKEHSRNMVLPKIFLCIGVCFLAIFLLNLLAWYLQLFQ